MIGSINRTQTSLGRLQSVFSGKSGEILGVNKKRLYETPFLLNTNPPSNSVTIPTSGVSKATGFKVNNTGPIQLQEVGILRTGVCSAMLFMQDGAYTRRLMNAPCHVDCIFGSAGLMYPLPEALYLDEGRSLSVSFADLSAAPNAAQMTFNGAKYSLPRADPNLARIKERLAAKQYLSMPYWYTFDQQQVALTGLGTSSIEILIGEDHHFEAHQLSFVSTGNFSINIVDENSNESIVNAPSNGNYLVPHLTLMGTNQFPYRFSEPWLISAGQRLLVSLQDTSGSANTVFMAIGGRYLSLRSWL